jgi:hypothetical protein
LAATAITLAASAARTSSGAGTAQDITNAGASVRLTLSVTANDNTPGNPNNPPRAAFDVAIETSFDGSTDWREIFSTDPARAPKRFQPGATIRTERRVFVGADRFVRARWTIDGVNPSVTFSVSGEAI